MGRKSRENRERRERLAARSQQIHYTPLPTKKKRLSNAKKMLIGIALVAIIAVAASIALSSPSPSSQTPGQSYPQSIAPVTYQQASVTAVGDKVTVPQSYVNSNKLVFVDLKLETTTQTLEYQGRTIPLAYYRNGEYLPLIVISTPSGNTVAGIRTCEPCGSFSFHIVQGTNLKCDACGAEWRLEDFAPVSGGCAAYPPPKLTSTISGDSIEIDLSPLAVQVAA